jgi:hypothetical protein
VAGPIRDEAGPRRLLIATGVTTGLPDGTDGVRESLNRIAALFQRDFGYTRATALDLNPALDQLRRETREFALKCKPTDLVVLYYTGFAGVVAEEHRLWVGDTGADPIAGTIVAGDLVQLILADTPVSNLLIILDMCLSAQGDEAALATDVRIAGSLFEKNVYVITATHPPVQASSHDFVNLFERSVTAPPAVSSPALCYLPLSAMTRYIQHHQERPPWLTVSYGMLYGTGEAKFFPNPRYRAVGDEPDLAVQHAFISYVREDSADVDDLQRALQAAGISVWRDTADLWAGQDWRIEIRRAITNNSLVFIACFSSHSAARRQSYQNEELLLAIDQLRLRPVGDPWLIPVRFDDCDIPEFDLGGGRTLGSLQRAELFGDDRDVQLARLVTIVQRAFT